MKKNAGISKSRNLEFSLKTLRRLFPQKRTSPFFILLILVSNGANASQRNLSLPTEVVYEFEQVMEFYYTETDMVLTYYPLKVAFSVMRAQEDSRSGYRFGGAASISEVRIVKGEQNFFAPSKCLLDLSWPIQAIGAAGMKDEIWIEIKTVGLRNPDEKRGLVLRINTETQEATCGDKLTEDW